MSRKLYLQFSKGYWYVEYFIPEFVDGEEKLKRRWKSLGIKGKENKKKAEKALHQLEFRMQIDTRNNELMEANLTVAEYIERYLRELKGSIRQSTMEQYTRRLGQFALRFGHVRLVDLAAAHIEAWKAELIKLPWSSRTVNTALRVLRTSLRHAVRQELISRDPTRNVRYIDVRSRLGEFPPYWTSAQFRSFVDFVPPEQYKLAFCLAFYAGLRLREVTFLRWEDVKETHIVVSSHDEFRTKSDNSRRIPIAAALAAELNKHPDRQGGVIWGTEPRRTPATISTRFQYYRRRYNLKHPEDPLPEITFHGLRHSFATNLAPRMQLIYLSKLLGHSKIETTMIYAHVQADAALDIASTAMNDVF
jgi:integrase